MLKISYWLINKYIVITLIRRQIQKVILMQFPLTFKHRETHGCVVSTVATEALVLKHQAISIHNADETSFLSFWIIFN